MDRNMMLTSDEYIALMRLISSERESEGASLVARSESKPKTKRRPSKYNMAFAKAYDERRKRHSTTKGMLRKGYDHRRLMELAHSDVRRSMKG